MKHLTQEQYRVSEWSGGKTVEIAIAPDGAEYAGRDFLWRLSSATVELDESDFTALPDYERWIAPLCGGLRLRHNAGQELRLSEYETHRFDGADATHSWGRCTDFNLMLRKGRCEGGIFAITGRAGEQKPLEAPDELILYCARGAVEIDVGGTRTLLKERDALRCAPGEAKNAALRFVSDGCVMAAQIKKL